MKTFLKILFVLNSAFLGAILYTSIKGRFEQHNSGWDGLANALENLAIGFIIFLIVGFVIGRKLSDKSLMISTIGLSVISIALISITWLQMRAKTNKALEHELSQQTKVAPDQKGLKNSLSTEGVAKIKIQGSKTIHLLTAESKNRNINFSIQDSIEFNDDWSAIEYAPLYFSPFYSKVDYNLLLLKVISRMDKAVEVIVNELEQRTAYIDNSEVEFMDWPSFILNVNSVEIIYEKDNLLRSQPLSHTPPLDSPIYTYLQPKKIQGDWLQVNLLDDDQEIIREAWVMWNYNGQIALRFNPLM